MLSKEEKKKKKKINKKEKEKENKQKSTKESKKNENKQKNIKLLIIDSEKEDWDQLFSSVEGITVDQCEWKHIMVHSDSGKVPPLLSLWPNPNSKNIQRQKGRLYSPDFILVRQLVRGINHDQDYTNALYGLIFSGVPAVNSLMSIHQSLERPIVYRHLYEISCRLGKERFPLIPMTYYSHHSVMSFTPQYPIVVKVGYAEAGYGKMKFDSHENFNDFIGVMALHKDYVTIESYIEDREYDIRVQKIGDHIRAYKRINPNWKGNVGTSIIEELEVTDTFREWATECGKLFGGVDILTVDAVHTKDGKDWILEINDTASGFLPSNMEEDMQHVKDLVLSRIKELL